MPHVDGNIPSIIYSTFVGSEIFRFARTTSDMNTTVTLSNRHLKRLQRKGTKKRSIISMLPKIFCKQVTVLEVFADTVVNFLKLFLLSWIRIIHFYVLLLNSLYMLFLFCLFFSLSVCLVFIFLLFLCHLYLFLRICTY